MPLNSNIVPFAGQVLICDFGPEPAKVSPPGIMRGPLGVAPEMFKKRHAVVIGAGRGLTTVVPFSTAAPKSPQKYHHSIPAGKYPFFDPDEENWAKTDMLGTVSNQRLDRPFVAGVRATVRLDGPDLFRIRETILHWIGLSKLTPHL